MIISENMIVASEGIEMADLDGEAILLDVNSGLYYGLSGVGAHIMNLIYEPTSLSDLLENMLGEFDVESAQLEKDVIVFLKEMEERQLIRIMNGAAS